MGNLSLPGTSSFVGEFLILVGVFQTNPFVATFAATGMILGGAYSIWLYNRVVFGNLKPFFIDTFMDVNRREFFIFLPFCVLCFMDGVLSRSFFRTNAHLRGQSCAAWSMERVTERGYFTLERPLF